MPSVTCNQCKISFEKRAFDIAKTKNNNFCSRSCSAIFNNKGKQKNKPTLRTCKGCCSTYTTSGGHRSINFCSECFQHNKDKYKQLTIGEYRKKVSVAGKHPSWLHAHIRSFCRSWNKQLAKLACEICGYDKHVDLCHIKAVSSYGDNITLGEVNHPDNIRVLCKNHHWEFDHNLLD